MRQKSQVRLSAQACFRPSQAEASSTEESETLSFSMREWASCLSVSLSHIVSMGVLGRSQKPQMATKAVAAPSRMNSLGWSGQQLFVFMSNLRGVCIPSPARNATHAVEAGKDACGDEAGEAGSQDLGAVEQGDAGGDLCNCISLQSRIFI